MSFPPSLHPLSRSNHLSIAAVLALIYCHAICSQSTDILPASIPSLCSNTPLHPSAISSDSLPFHLSYPIALLAHPPAPTTLHLCPCIHAAAAPPSPLSSCLPCALASCICAILHESFDLDSRAIQPCARAAQVAHSAHSSSSFTPDLSYRLSQLLWRSSPGHPTATSIMISHCSSSPSPSSCRLSLLIRSAAASDGNLGSAAALASKAFELDKGPRPLRLFARAHFYSEKLVQEALDGDGDVFANMRVDQAAEVAQAMTNSYLASSRCR